MRVFEFNSYKNYVLEYVENAGKRGIFREIATAIGANSSAVSQIFRGPLDLNLDQALLLTDYLGLATLERDYFLLLVQKERAGTERLRKHLESQLKELHKKARTPQGHVSEHEELKEKDQSEFYSDWTYSAIRLSTSLPGLEGPELIAKHFNIPLRKVVRILEFLVDRGLCKKDQNGYGVGISKTHLSPDSPYSPRHHSNWRLKAMEHYPSLKERELAFTSPMTLSKKDFQKVKDLLLQSIAKTHEILGPSPNEVLGCLNIDWFEIR